VLSEQKVFLSSAECFQNQKHDSRAQICVHLLKSPTGNIRLSSPFIGPEQVASSRGCGSAGMAGSLFLLDTWHKGIFRTCTDNAYDKHPSLVLTGPIIIVFYSYLAHDVMNSNWSITVDSSQTPGFLVDHTIYHFQKYKIWTLTPTVRLLYTLYTAYYLFPGIKPIS
jgi:hypothetical protein